MNSLLLCIIVFFGYFIAYHTYGRFLVKHIFKLNDATKTPAEVFRDNIDYLPSKKDIVFGHHFTSIAGLGPILGPAIGIIWGWIPAILWCLLGSIFIGAVHDFASLVISLRNEGKSIGEVATHLISARVRTLFLLIIFFALWIVIAIFALVIAILFDMYPESVFPVWVQIPIAMWLGWMVYKRKSQLLPASIVACALMYASILVGAVVPLKMPSIGGYNPITIWVVILFAYAYIASTLPVWQLLQPRDYINAHQLIIMLVLLFAGVIVAHPQMAAPGFNPSPEGAPSLLPFLFVVIACGAVSGFHSLVSSGTSSKQIAKESDSQFVGYGGMLMEASLSTLVVVACGAGLGMGLLKGNISLVGVGAWNSHYSSWAAAQGMSSKIAAFVTGATNLLSSYKIPSSISVTILGVFLVSFAGTTLDSATRIQRYVISELATDLGFNAVRGRYVATFIAVSSAMLLAFTQQGGKGALVLWPLFGSVNQLLAGLALLVATVYLVKNKRPPWTTAIPMVFMIAMTGWAMVLNIKNFYSEHNLLLFIVGLCVLVLEIWMIVETVLILGSRVGENI